MADLTAGKVPKAANATQIEDGFATATTVGETGSDTTLVTEQGIREAIVAGGGGAEQLSDLSDVGVSTPDLGLVLRGDGDSWESSYLLLADLGDVGDTTWTAGNLLQADGNSWESVTIATTVGNPGSDIVVVSEQAVREGITAIFSTANTFTALQTFTSLPTGIGVAQASLYVNPAGDGGAATNTIFGVALNGAWRLRIAANGDFNAYGGVNLAGGTFALSTWGDYTYMNCLKDNGLILKGTTVSQHRVYMGPGSVMAELTLGAHLDQSDVLIRRDTTGVGSYSEAGTLLKLERDVTNVTSEDGNYIECDAVFDVDKNGKVTATGATFGDGGTTDYAAFAADGSLTFAGAARKTSHMIFDNADLGKGGTVADQVIIGDYTGWEFDINDDAVVVFELPDAWAAGTDVDIKVCWYCDEDYATNSGEVQWEVAWSACPEDMSELIDNPTHTGTLDSGDINLPTNGKELLESAAGTISGGSLSAGDAIGLTLKRVTVDTGSPGVNPSAKPTVIHMEAIFTIGQMGE